MFGANYFGQPYFAQGYAVTIISSIQWDAASNSGYQVASSSYSWSHTVTNSNTNPGLIVNVSIFLTGTVTGITYNGTALQFVRSDTTGTIRNEIWQLSAPSTGTHTIAVTLSTPTTSFSGADSYTGVNQIDMVETNTGSTGGGSTTPSVTVTTVTNNSWVLSGLTTSDTTETVGGSATQRNNQTNTLGTGAISDYGPQVTAGNVTMSWSAVGSLNTWSMGVVVLQPYSGTVYSLSLVGLMSSTGVILRTTNRNFTATYSTSGTLSKLILRVFTATYKTSAIISAMAIFIPLTAIYSVSGLLTKKTNKSLNATYSVSGNFSRLISRSFTASYQLSATLLSLIIFVPFSATYQTIGNLIKRPNKILTATYQSSGSLSRRTNRILTATYKVSGSFTRATTRVLTATFITLPLLIVPLKAKFTANFIAYGNFYKQAQKNFQAQYVTSGWWSRYIKARYVPILTTILSGIKSTIDTSTSKVTNASSGAKIDNVSTSTKNDQIQSGAKVDTVSSTQKETNT